MQSPLVAKYQPATGWPTPVDESPKYTQLVAGDSVDRNSTSVLVARTRLHPAFELGAGFRMGWLRYVRRAAAAASVPSWASGLAFNCSTGNGGLPTAQVTRSPNSSLGAIVGHGVGAAPVGVEPVGVATLDAEGIIDGLARSVCPGGAPLCAQAATTRQTLARATPVALILFTGAAARGIHREAQRGERLVDSRKVARCGVHDADRRKVRLTP
jgi:hypothetical protein